MRVDTETRAVCLREPPQDVLGGLVDIGAAGVLREVVDQGYFRQLLLEHVDLVQEENDRGAEEPSRVDHRLEQNERLLHAVLTVLLEQHLVVLAEGDTEDD